MTVYIDAQKRYKYERGRISGSWCHLWADELDELHGFAEQIGLRREWFQEHERHPHYDVGGTRMRTKAMDAGAVPLSYAQWLRKQDAIKETDIGKKVVVWLREWGWDVWQEIMFRAGSNRADVVGLRCGFLCVVEAKTALTFDLIAQAIRWPLHLRYIAVPFARMSDGRDFAFRVCRAEGVGVLTVGRYDAGVEEVVRPRILRIPRKDVAEKIHELSEMPQDYAVAGSPSGSVWSSYKGTMERIRRFLVERPGATIAEILAHVEHHYSNAASAKSAIPKWLQSVEAEWCRVERDGRYLRFFVREGCGVTSGG